MLHKQQDQRRQRQRRGSSSLLELEAAEYFKLDLSQLDLSHSYRAGHGHSDAGLDSFTSSYHHHEYQSARTMPTTTTTATAKSRSDRGRPELAQSSRNRCNDSMSHGRQQRHHGSSMARGAGGSTSGFLQSEKATQTRMDSAMSTEPSRDHRGQRRMSQGVRDNTRRSDGTGRAGLGAGCGNQGSPHRGPPPSAPTVIVGSSTTSTNSLPSITSSPSVSPSLVCPHLSLDDIIDCRFQNSNGSPHTIGLCARCRLDPPPNIHSPLSPQFRPNSRTSGTTSLGMPKRVRRGYSDHNASYCSIKQTRKQQQQQQANSQTCHQMPPAVARHQSDLNRLRDDSLDFCLEPSELRRMQLSPTMRNSVEFIRRNSIESGRVIKIYKNGEPFEKPLRICILRGEFSTLTHLLDHINSRLLIALGARYLFHLDGQLVYSVHELKHGSVYVVSGTRSFDYRTSEVLKEQQKREQMNRLSQEQRTQIRQQFEVSGSGSSQQLHTSNTNVASVRRSSGSRQTKSPSSSIEFLAGKQQQQDHPRIGSKQGSNQQPLPASLPGGNRPQASKPRQPRPSGLSFRSIEPRRAPPAQKPATGKFSRYDGKTGLISSGGNQRATPTASELSMNAMAMTDDEKPIMLTRAKSELSALPMKKQKKNVTFKDTGRGSSPAISDLSSSGHDTATTISSTNGTRTRRTTVSRATQPEPPPAPQPPPALVIEESVEQQKLKNELGTSEVGIQVSDSIDGFLIDLPVALPARGDDSSLADPANHSRARPGGQRFRGPNRSGEGESGGAGGGGLKRVKQIVTITERQLSHEEMTELTDLSEGDHHDLKDHHEVIIKWGPLEEPAQKGAPPSPDSDKMLEAELVPDRSNTIAIGKDPQSQMIDAGGRLVTSAVASEQIQDPGAEAAAARTNGHWQYPGGDVASSTPAERPVSQIGPNESVRARVTTPTPSLSTGGDNNSLTLSYETSGPTTTTGDGSQEIRVSPRQLTSDSGRHAAELPAKRHTEVMGSLCEGLDTPTRNFRLVWVNGFSINDIYPDNSVDVQRLAESEAASTNSQSRSGEPQGQMAAARLSPGQRSVPAANEFKPSERYHNWICHSRKHDELVYPAGSLIVLWCRWTNEQRYYARHTSNVSCLTLATPDSDLAASAQTRDPFEARQLGSVIHLWCLSSLELLRVIEDDQYRSKMIFSMRLKSSKSTGFELSVAARDEKQLFLFEFSAKLAPDKPDADERSATTTTATGKDRVNLERRNSKGTATAGAIVVGTVKQQLARGDEALIMRASKILQSNQLPLFVLRVPKLRAVGQGDTTPTTNPTPSVAKQQLQVEPLISFGRRHFGMWAPDVKQQKLRPMQPEQKSGKLNELVSRANCLCRISPDEFLLGDSDGSIAMLLINCGSNQTPTRTTVSINKRKVQPKPLDSVTDSRYSIETIELIGGQATNSTATGSISCLTRISGSLFMSADSSCTIRFWRITRGKSSSMSTDGQATSDQRRIACEQLSSISLPPDLGFICSILLAQYNLKESIVEFYVVSTSNSILFGSVKLPQLLLRANRVSSAGPQQQGRPAGKESGQQQRQPPSAVMLANSSLSVVYEGHETSASGLVADLGPRANDEQTGRLYFTCSLDCRICKWNGKQLIWKSMLPSSCVSLAVHPLGCVLAVGSVDGTVYILDKTSGLLISYFPLTPVRINCLAYSRDGSLLAAGCANGSIFMLPVDERGLKYKKVSIFQSPSAVVSLQFSLDNRYMLTSVSHGSYQELILWDLPNFRYMRDDVKLAADKIQWFDSICSGSEDVRAIWENAHVSTTSQEEEVKPAGRSTTSKRSTAANVNTGATGQTRNKPADQFVVNLSCHRLIRSTMRLANEDENNNNSQAAGKQSAESFVIASDTRGYIRLFRYPAYDIQQGFYAARICSSAVNCCRFLTNNEIEDHHHHNQQQQHLTDPIDYFVSTSLDGSICLWALE